MKILVIEDEAKARDYMRKGLTEAGFIVDVADNGVDGLFYAREHHYDLILLDVMLPGIDGWQVMAEMDQQIHTPVIFLTAKGTLEDRIKGLELGADDYLLNPFPLPNCWRASVLNCGAAASRSCRTFSRWPICSSTSLNAASSAVASASISPTKSSTCCTCFCCIRAKC